MCVEGCFRYDTGVRQLVSCGETNNLCFFVAIIIIVEETNLLLRKKISQAMKKTLLQTFKKCEMCLIDVV